MATTNDFDYGWDGISEPASVPASTTLGTFNWAWDGGVAMATEEAAPAAGSLLLRLQTEGLYVGSVA